MPSDFMEILQDIQKDLNEMTLSTIVSNHWLSELISMYNSGEYTQEKNRECSKSWSEALQRLTNSIIEFGDDSARLEAYINGQR